MPELKEKDIEDILTAKYGHRVSIKDMKTDMLTKPGENYGSTMLAIDVELEDKTKLSLVAKMVPESPYLQEVFQCPVTVRKEMALYLLVSPEYDKIQKEMDIPKDGLLQIFPKCYGARATKGEDVGQPADQDAMILLENLSTRNFCLGDRLKGFDLAHTEFIVSKLAEFHGIAIAIKLRKPEVFRNTVLKACAHLKLKQEEFIQTSIKTLDKIPECEAYIDRVKSILDKHRDDRADTTSYVREPFATMVHEDFWTNNMMLQYQTKNRDVPVDIKMIDFQLLSYNSPAKDFLFFLYTSTAEGVVEKYYEKLVRVYHNSFTRCLENLKCSALPFSFQDFLEEIDFVAPREFGHIFFMLKHILLDKEKAKNLSEFSLDDFHNVDFNNEIYDAKMTTLLREFDKNGWL